MTPELWQQVRDVLAEALELSPQERPAFLDRACASDHLLRREVNLLLSSSDAAQSSFLESSPLSADLTGLDPDMTGTILEGRLGAGERIGPYLVLEFLRAGGMGEVYKAIDTRLERTVAIKFLPSAFATDPVALDRFRREVRAASALDHPRICTIYDVGDHKGQPFFVMEFLEGKSLKERIAGRPLPVSELLDMAIQICDALQAAHAKGIVHRDIKSGNVFITTSGQVKVLDFGLAKRAGEAHQDATATAADNVENTLPSNEVTLTRPGSVIGTAAYLSPEQARGEEVDARTDIYSLGVVLYEMATGHPTFRGETSDELIHSILNDTPVKPSALNPAMPSRLEQVILRALAKERPARYQTIAELLGDLRKLQQPSPQTKWRWIGSAGVVLVVASATLSWHPWSSPRLTVRDTIVLADISNRTGDPVFDGTLRQGLAVELAQSPFLNLLSDQKISETLRMMGRPANVHVTMDDGRELCLRTGSKALLGGTISSLGSHYVIDLGAVACSTGDTLAKEQGEATGKEDVLKTLSRASSSLRAKLGESLPSVQKFDVPIEATTSSLEALQDYSLGIAFWQEKGGAAALPFLKRAIELDPNFPMAYSGLASEYRITNQPSLELEYATKAYQLRDRVTELERLNISAAYFSATGELDKEAQTYELWATNYPRDSLPHAELGLNYNTVGAHEKALQEHLETLRLSPDRVTSYDLLAFTYVLLNRLDEAKATLDRAHALKLDSGGLHAREYSLASLRGDAAQMEQQLSWSVGKPGLEDMLLSTQSDTEAFYGHLNKARDFSRRASASAIRADSNERAALWQANAAFREAELGNIASAKQGVRAALELSSGRDVKIAAALALARVADRPRAKALAEDLEQNYPLNTIVKFYWVPTINALNELSSGNSSQALMDLEATAPYELSFIGDLYPAYVRGQAYLLSHSGSAAMVEFQKLLDHRGIVANSVTGSLGHLQIGRAYALRGDTDKARAAYEDFLALWKDADPDIPVLRNAKAEYQKLK